MKRFLIGCGSLVLVAVLVVVGGLFWILHDYYHPSKALMVEVPMTKTPPPEGATELSFDPWGYGGAIEAVLPPGVFILSVRFVPEEGVSGGPARIVATADDEHRDVNIDCSAEGLAEKMEDYADGQQRVSNHGGGSLLPQPWTHIGAADPPSAVWYLGPLYDIRGATAHRRGFTFHVAPTGTGTADRELPPGRWYARVERYIDAV